MSAEKIARRAVFGLYLPLLVSLAISLPLYGWAMSRGGGLAPAAQGLGALVLLWLLGRRAGAVLRGEASGIAADAAVVALIDLALVFWRR